MIRRALMVVVLLLSSLLVLSAPASASPPLTACYGYAQEAKIAFVYSYGVPYADRVLRCGNGRYGYKHFVGRWLYWPDFSATISATMRYGQVERQGTALVFRCYSPIIGCRGTTFKVVYETQRYSDGFDKGIITATYGS